MASDDEIPEEEADAPLPAPAVEDADRAESSPPTPRLRPEGSGDDAGSNMLMQLLQLRPFTAFFCYLAEELYGDDPSAQRAARHRQDAPWFYRFCVGLDVAIMTIAVVALLALSITIAAKAVWPPPWWL